MYRVSKRKTPSPPHLEWQFVAAFEDRETAIREAMDRCTPDTQTSVDDDDENRVAHFVMARVQYAVDLKAANLPEQIMDAYGIDEMAMQTLVFRWHRTPRVYRYFVRSLQGRMWLDEGKYLSLARAVEHAEALHALRGVHVKVLNSDNQVVAEFGSSDLEQDHA